MTGQEARDDERVAWGRLEAVLKRYLSPHAIAEVRHDLGADFAAGYRKHPEPEPTFDEWRASIMDERFRQSAKGYDEAHDRGHGLDHLLVWAQDYARRGEPLKSAALIEAARELVRNHPEPEIDDEILNDAISRTRYRAQRGEPPYPDDLETITRAALRVPVGEGEQ